MKTLEYYVNKMPTIVNWLESYGTKARCSRYSRYTQYIELFFTYTNSKERKNKEFYDLIEAAKECLLLSHIYDSFSTEKSHGFTARIDKIIGGPDFISTNQPDCARNYLFELFIASFFFKKGFRINFDTLTDVIAEKNGSYIFIECKKIYSEKKIQKNVNDAIVQLTREMSKFLPKAYGMVYFDISLCVDNDTIKKPEFPSEKHGLDAVKKEIENFKIRQSKISLFNKTNNSSSFYHGIGTVVIAVFKTMDVSLYAGVVHDITLNPFSADNNLTELEILLE